MRSPSDSCLVSRVLQASYGNILVAIMPKTHTAPLAGSIVGVQPGLTDVSGLCHLYHCALFITTQASSSQLPSIASQRLLLEFLPCHALPDLRSSLKHRTKKSTNNLLCIFHASKDSITQMTLPKQATSLGCILNIQNSTITAFLGVQISYAFSAL